SGGLVYAALVGSASTDSGSRDSVTSASGVVWRAGVGVNIRTSKKFALQPEVSMMRRFNDATGTIVVFGLGFNFGSLPSFDDIGGNGGEAAPLDPAQNPTPAPSSNPPSNVPVPSPAPPALPPAPPAQ